MEKLDLIKIGTALRAARFARGLTMRELVDIVNDDIYTHGSKEELNEGKYGTWERGDSAMPIKWIPLLCKHLHCDVGYLFGEYHEFTRPASDVCEYTGLSQESVSVLRKANMGEAPFGIKVIDDYLPTKDCSDFFASFDRLLKEHSQIIRILKGDYSEKLKEQKCSNSAVLELAVMKEGTAAYSLPVLRNRWDAALNQMTRACNKTIDSIATGALIEEWFRKRERDVNDAYKKAINKYDKSKEVD